MAWTVLRTVTDSVSYVTAADHNETKANFDIVGGADGATKTGNWYVTGNVGIGTSSPGANLDIVGGTTVGLNYLMKLSPAAGTTAANGLGRESSIGFAASFSNNWVGTDYAPRYSGAITYGAYGGTTNPRSWSMRFMTGDDLTAGDTPAERMRLSATTHSAPGATLRVGGIVSTHTASNYTAINQEVNRHSIVFSSWRDAQPDTLGAKIQAINYTSYTSGGGTNFHLVQTTDLAFYTLGVMPTTTDATVERMRITSAGNVGIGTSSPASMLTVAGDVQIAPATGGAYLVIKGVQAGQNAHLYFYTSNALKWVQYSNDSNSRLYFLDADSNDGVYIAQNATTWTANSDSRLKDVKETIANALDKVNQLTGVKFTWKRDADNPDAKTRVGLIAQDVQAAFPEAVDDDTPELVTDEVTGKVSGGLGVRYTELIPLLVNAIKELAQRVEALEA